MPENSSLSLYQRIQQVLFKPVSIVPLIYFRVAFGLIMLYQVLSFFTDDRLARYYIEPKHLFTFYGFEWVQAWPGMGMHIHFMIMGILAVFITVGFLYRWSMLLYFLAFTYVFLLDQTRYLNHFYMVSLISFIMIFAPANKVFSVDSVMKPSISSSTIPYWALFLLQAQLAIVYFFGGIAKLNYDWLHGEPIRMWLAKRFDLAVVGPYVTDEWLVYLICYSGLLFDLFIIPLIIWKRTRWIAFSAALLFHLVNSWLFNIGIFPWFMIAATAILFIPGWKPFWRPTAIKKKKQQTEVKNKQLITGFVVLYLTIQILMPLRHWLYPGNVNWTEEGHKYSWRMKLRSKINIGHFYIVDPVMNRRKEIPASFFLDDWQEKVVLGVPDLIVQFAHMLEEDLRKEGVEGIEIKGVFWTSLNGRNFQPLMDSTVNLLDLEVGLAHNPHITPLKQPFVNTRKYNLEQLEKVKTK